MTVSAWNKNNTSKPASKTVKLNVTPNDSAPEWGSLYEYTYISGDTSTSNSKTYTTSSYTEWEAWKTEGSGSYKGGENLELSSGVNSSRKYVLLTKNSKPVEVKYYFVDGVRQRYSLTESGYAYDDFSSSLGDDNAAAWEYVYYETEQRGKYWYAAIPDSFYVTVTDTSAATDDDSSTGEIEYITTQLFTAISPDKKAQPEIVTAVYPSAAEGSRGGRLPDTAYYVKAPAPFLIDTPKAPKDEGIVITVNQPSFDYLGNNTVSGSVYIYGTLKETSKESKNKIKLKVSNPTTKQKAQLTVTVSGKTVPEFPKLADFKFDTSILNEDTYSDALLLDYGYDDTRKKLITKRVTAGKTPKAKFKADGSKTITYKLGLYNAYGSADGYTAFHHARAKFTGDAELWDYMYGYIIKHSMYSQYGEQFNKELEANLAAHNLSFDIKKGSVVQLVSGVSTTPTLNDAGTQFASLDLAVTAVNDVGTAQAWAELAITGDKPKVADKTVSIYGAVQKGDVFTFKLTAGKTIAESVRNEGGSINVRTHTASDTDTKTLSDWGLELVNYDSMDILVSDEVTYEAGEEIPGYDPAKQIIVDTGDYDNLSEAVSSTTTVDDAGNSTTTYNAGDYGVTLLSGDTWIRSKDVRYINYGLIQVKDSDALAKVIVNAQSADTKGKALKKLEKGSKVNLTLDNFGAIAKGKITVALLSNITSKGDPAHYNASSNGALPANNGKGAESARRTRTADGYISNNGTLPNADSESESEEANSVTIGTPRTFADLSAEQKVFLSAKGYAVIAVMPEITANLEGQQDFAVELDEDSPEGAELVYIPFPKNAQETEDDNIADFYDSEGAFIERVPAEKDIVVCPWLREGVTYEPVIAAKSAEK